jgi:AcrR family transcriptional regulator
MWYMNQMVHSAMTASQPRDRLLAAAVEQAMRGGIADLSLRELAAAIGTSHRMLLYHFGSREGLLVAVAQAVEEAERARFLSWGMAPQDTRRIWERLSDPVLWPSERLFFELYVQALLGRLGDDQFLDSAVKDWIAPVAAAMVEAGASDATAQIDARLGQAVVRGLLLDLLATKDRDGVTEAFDRFVQLYETAHPDASAYD